MSYQCADRASRSPAITVTGEQPVDCLVAARLASPADVFSASLGLRYALGLAFAPLFVVPAAIAASMSMSMSLIAPSIPKRFVRSWDMGLTCKILVPFDRRGVVKIHPCFHLYFFTPPEYRSSPHVSLA